VDVVERGRVGGSGFSCGFHGGLGVGVSGIRRILLNAATGGEVAWTSGP
jgi:hypothetical protein